MSRMPKNWEPPYPSWICDLGTTTETIAVAYVGVQYPRSCDASREWATVLDLTKSESGPAHVTTAHYRDASNYENSVAICYWSDPARYSAFTGGAAFAPWWNSSVRLTGDVGVWWEGFDIPLCRAETIFSSTEPEGVAHIGDRMSGPIREHAYPGAARERIRDSSHDAFETSHKDRLRRLSPTTTRGARLRVVPPDNLCLILSGQNWSDCSRDEFATYADVVQPNLRAGMDFLRDNPLETGCLSCRFMDETDASGRTISKSFAAALFLTMKHLEDWTWSHPTHRAIFQSFHELVKARDFKLDLKLWHEVFVLRAAASRFGYLNCHPGTGLLPFFPAVPSAA